MTHADGGEEHQPDATMLVEDEAGDLYAVEPDGDCSCGVPGCEHQQRAAAACSPSRSLAFTAKSGLHKEVRRGDVARALGWAEIVERTGRGTVVAYLRRIVCEETRNLDLLPRLQTAPADTWPEMVALSCRSTKDWEFDWDVGWWSPAWVHCAGGGQEMPLLSAVVNAGADGDALATKLLRAAQERRPDLSDALSAAAFKRDNDEISVLLAVAEGRFTDEALHYREGSDPDPIHVPWPADYVWDCHTWRGMERISAASPPLKFGQPLPAGLDLRWSGAEAGTLWRYLAWREHGTCDVPWEAVVPDQDLRDAHASLVTKAWMDWKGIPPEVV